MINDYGAAVLPRRHFFSLLRLDNRRRAAACVLARTAQRPVLLVTHDEADAKALSARIIRLV